MNAKAVSERRLLVTVGRCVGCHSCEVACAVAHSASKDLVKALAEDPRPNSRVTVVPVGEHSVPLQCVQCDEPLCVEVCPKKALEKGGPDGAVLLDEELCIGCGFCVMVCPYGAIRVDAGSKKAFKCDLCVERVEEGDDPACVESCPVVAIEFK